MPQAFWTFAACTFCFLRNVQADAYGDSAWARRYKHKPAKDRKFNGRLVPFGSYVLFYPPTTTKAYKQQEKFEERLKPGVFLGYELGVGGAWRKHYRVMPISAFDNLPLIYSTKKLAATQASHKQIAHLTAKSLGKTTTA